MNSWSKLLDQTHPHWVLFAIADAMPPVLFERFQYFLHSFYDPTRLISVYLDAGLREVAMYAQSEDLKPCSLWCLAGANALNLGFNLIAGINGLIETGTPYFTHVARLDYDNDWNADHLENLAEAFRFIPNASFAYSRARGYTGSSEGYPFLWMLGLNASAAPLFSLLPPRPCMVIHSTVAWSLSHVFTSQLRFRQRSEQVHTVRDLNVTTCVDKQHQVFPVDADLWQLIMAAEKRQVLVSVFINRADVNYRDSEEKQRVVAFLRSLYHSAHAPMSSVPHSK
jgi:hypothetical protein